MAVTMQTLTEEASVIPVLTVGDIATVIDGFAEQDVIARLNGKPALFLELFRLMLRARK